MLSTKRTDLPAAGHDWLPPYQANLRLSPEA